MAEIITHSEWIERYEYSLFFEDLTCKGAGYGFTCDSKGQNVKKPDVEEVWPQAKFDEFLKTHEGYKAPIVHTFDMSYKQPALLKCDCGNEVCLEDAMDNQCDSCGAIYNSTGQRVRCFARDIDPMDAGERYEDDD